MLYASGGKWAELYTFTCNGKNLVKVDGMTPKVYFTVAFPYNTVNLLYNVFFMQETSIYTPPKRRFFTVTVLVSLLLCGLMIAGTILYWYHRVPLDNGIYTIGNAHITWNIEVSNGVLSTHSIVNKRTGDILKPNGEDFLFTVGHASSIGWAPEKKQPGQKYNPYLVKDAIAVSPEKCIATWLTRRRGEWTFELVNPDMNCTIELTFRVDGNSPWIYRDMRVFPNDTNDVLATDQAAYHVQWKVDATAERGGRGQPLFLNGEWFLALEHPWAQNTYKSGTIRLTQYPGDRYGADGFSFRTMVIGCAPENETVREVFNEYVDSFALPPRSITLYNSWYDVREDDLTEEAMADRAEKFEAGLEKHGASLDTLVIDDGWFNKRSIFERHPARFPRPFRYLSEELAKHNTGLGIWLSISGLNTDVPYGKTQGYETAGSKYYCMSGRKYNSELRERIGDLIVNQDVMFFKHDFNFFHCGMTDHGHFPTMEQSTERNVDALLSILAYERSLKPDIYVAITTGIWPSPWWLGYADVIWMGGGDIVTDRNYPATLWTTFEMNYRDKALYARCIVDDYIFPLSRYMTHGVSMGNSGHTCLIQQGDTQWADYLMQYLGRGTLMREFYVSPELFNEKKWEVMAKAIEWARENDERLAQSRFLFGNPRRYEPVAYTGTSEGRRYTCIRNPRVTNVTISLEKALLTNGVCEVVYPYHAFMQSDAGKKLEMPGESVLVAETYGIDDRQRPVPLEVRSELVSIEDNKTVYRVYYTPGMSRQIRFSNREVIEKVTCNGLPATQADDGSWYVDVPEEQIPDCPDVEVTGINFTEKAIVEANVTVPGECTARAYVYLKGKHTPVSLVNNNKRATGETVNGEGWQITIVECNEGGNELRLQFHNPGNKQIEGALYIEVKRKLPAVTIAVTHESLSAEERTKPVPISQDTYRSVEWVSGLKMTGAQ